MTRFTKCLLVLAVANIATVSGAAEHTYTGWFSDLDCATARAGTQHFTATNPDCAKRCLAKGIPPAFISEQTKGVYKIKGYNVTAYDLGYHVELTGVIDEQSKTIDVHKVTRGDYQGPACARPIKKK